MILIDGLDLILLQKLLESFLEGLQAEVNLFDSIAGVDEDQVLVIADALGSSELSSSLLDQLAHPASL